MRIFTVTSTVWKIRHVSKTDLHNRLMNDLNLKVSAYNLSSNRFTDTIPSFYIMITLIQESKQATSKSCRLPQLIFVFVFVSQCVPTLCMIYVDWTSLVVQMVKNLLPMSETQVLSLSQEDTQEKEMTIHSRILA